MGTFSTLTYDLTDGLAKITLNRPEAANGINLAMGEDLRDLAMACSTNKDIRAVLITGTGTMFCGGGDLKSFADLGDSISEKLRELTLNLHTAITCFRRMNAPIIIAVNGTAAGAGMSLAVSGDYVFTSDKAKFTMAYTGVGLSPDGSGSYFLPRLIGMRKTQELMLTNRVLSAEEAYEWGLVNQVVSSEELVEASEALARQLASGPTQAYGSVKKLLNMSFENSLETQMEFESQFISGMSATEDGREGVQAFKEKRKPCFKGV
ncbi:enoyl-CoA hydratase [Aestuariicella hydrocarbonica]|uniref:Enoyl-CoA hydratase n=1 Tax=Pseudomaricurvus hydrocarbonicus TaxID=1470433 RepID=A0A9E5JS56_9GAMM|nr:enoyl-CoA hydratase-related protein [Aestuariicella hydrocarbonica]NHO65763.1 enoyl-CoA hydratase [Aestuariicella hydrocarbonica]